MITLIGVHHFDPDLYDRLETALDRLRPDAIALESTEYDFKEKIREYEATLGQYDLDELVDSGLRKYPDANPGMMRASAYNVASSERIADAYAKEHGTALYFADHPEEADAFLASASRSSQGAETLAKSLMEYLHADPEEYRQRIAEEYADEKYAVTDIPGLQESYTLRDAHAEKVLRGIEADSIVYIGGLDHLFGDYHNLYDRLQDLSPERRKLSEFGA